jgi:hypothetical protein
MNKGRITLNMSATNHILFRGNEEEVKWSYYEEHDVNVHELTWEFTKPELKDIAFTDEEIQSIEDQLYKLT